MNAFDFLLMAVVLSFAVIGALRGLVREVLALVTWVLACLFAWIFAGSAQVLFKDALENPEIRLVAGFAVVFVVVFVIGAIASYIVHRILITRRVFRLPNLVLGGAMGAARGVVVIVLAFMLAGITPITQYPWWREAMLTPFFQQLAGYVAGYLPQDVARHIRYG
jgi:membrane protein required for colicin V production